MRLLKMLTSPFASGGQHLTPAIIYDCLYDEWLTYACLVRTSHKSCFLLIQVFYMKNTLYVK